LVRSHPELLLDAWGIPVDVGPEKYDETAAATRAWSIEQINLRAGTGGGRSIVRVYCWGKHLAGLQGAVSPLCR